MCRDSIGFAASFGLSNGDTILPSGMTNDIITGKNFYWPTDKQRMHIYISAENYARMRKRLELGYEVGGTFDMRNDGELVPRFETTGGSSSITVRSNVPFNFHTHPGVCRDKSSCSFGFPSSQDMRQIAEAALKGNVAHFVVAHEGCYVVQARCATVEAVKRGTLPGSKLVAHFRAKQDQYAQMPHGDYESFASEWVSFANRNGFSVLFFPRHVTHIQCGIDPACVF